MQSVFLLLKYVADYVKLTVSALPGPYPASSRLPQSLSAEHRGGWRALGTRHHPTRSPVLGWRLRFK